MTSQSVVELMRGVMLQTFWLSLPLLTVGFVAGVLISLLQILTSIQDSVFSSVPRLTAFLLAILLAMPWMLAKLTSYTVQLFGDFGKFAH